MADVVNLAEHRERHRREGYRIRVMPGLWRGYEVTVEPTTATHPLRHFKSYDEAMACALLIQRAEGWPMFVNCGDGDGGHAA